MALLAPAPVQKHLRAYYALLLVLQTGLFGVFTALNFFHWFLFWEAGLIPMFFIIKLWGGEDAERAALAVKGADGKRLTYRRIDGLQAA